jgi:hypothetical protein
MKLSLLILLASSLWLPFAHAAPLIDRAPASKKAAPPKKSVAAADDISAPPRGTATAQTAAASGNRVLWDEWYTITVGDGIHYAFYNDHVEVKDGRVIFQTKTTKQEENFINQEQIGVFAEFTPELTPLFFNFHSTYRSTETTIDGNVKDGKQLSVRVKKGGTELPVIRRGIPPKTFFSTLFPVWLGFQLPGLQPGKLYGFNTLLEDNIEAGFSPVRGQLRIEAPDAIAQKTGTTKLMINYRDMKSHWWIEKTGAPVRIELPQQRVVVERADAKKAQAFLDGH